MRARAKPIVSGAEELLHTPAEALSDFDLEGPVWAHGERWNATTNSPVTKGQSLRITRVDGLRLIVEPVDSHSEGVDRWVDRWVDRCSSFCRRLRFRRSSSTLLASSLASLIMDDSIAHYGEAS